MTRCNQLFTIQDNNGMYVDKHSIWYNKESSNWNYNAYSNVNAPLTLCKSKEEAENIVRNLEKNLHKVSSDLVRTFSIKQLT